MPAPARGPIPSIRERNGTRRFPRDASRRLRACTAAPARSTGAPAPPGTTARPSCSARGRASRFTPGCRAITWCATKPIPTRPSLRFEDRLSLPRKRVGVEGVLFDRVVVPGRGRGRRHAAVARRLRRRQGAPRAARPRRPLQGAVQPRAADERHRPRLHRARRRGDRPVAVARHRRDGARPAGRQGRSSTRPACSRWTRPAACGRPAPSARWPAASRSRRSPTESRAGSEALEISAAHAAHRSARRP